MKISSDLANNTVSVSLDKDKDIPRIISENWQDLLTGDLFNRFDYILSKNTEGVEITLSPLNEELIANVFARCNEEKVISYLKNYTDFIFAPGNSSKYILGVNNVFAGDNDLLFVESLPPIEQSKANAMKGFLYCLGESAKEFSRELQQQLIAVCDAEILNAECIYTAIHDYVNLKNSTLKISELDMFNEDISQSLCSDEDDTQLDVKTPKSEDAAADDTDNKHRKRCPICHTKYDENYMFCIKCGAELDMDFSIESLDKPEETRPETDKSSANDSEELFHNIPVVQHNEEELKPVDNPESIQNKNYGETTLLGFTNYGETSVLGGGGELGIFDTPNLIRQADSRKIFITKRSFVIGKSPEKADYAVPDNSAVSRVHAEISVVGNEYFIIDRNSTNHTYVNGSMVPSDSSVQIYDGDEIKLADEVFVFSLK